MYSIFIVAEIYLSSCYPAADRFSGFIIPASSHYVTVFFTQAKLHATVDDLLVI
jgi:hypothetical protein